MPRRRGANPLYETLKLTVRRFDTDELISLFQSVDQSRVASLAAGMSEYIETNLPAAIEKRDGIADYRTNPYVLMTAAGVMSLDDPAKFGKFIFNSKLYMGLETSFGKAVEAAFIGKYPMGAGEKWHEAPEKIAEFAELEGLSREERAGQRTQSAWREIDKSVMRGRRRYMTTIKSGPNTINDTQVQAMTDAITRHHATWASASRELYPDIEGSDIVVGLTYGTDKTTNNKENQILAKLLQQGFEEEDRNRYPGVLVDSASRSVRVYRRIGRDFWAFIGNPKNPSQAQHVFLEVLLALAMALSSGIETADIETRINAKLEDLARALARLRLRRNSLPDWIRDDFTENELFWFATAMTAFYDEGI